MPRSRLAGTPSPTAAIRSSSRTSARPSRWRRARPPPTSGALHLVRALDHPVPVDDTGEVLVPPTSTPMTRRSHGRRLPCWPDVQLGLARPFRAATRRCPRWKSTRASGAVRVMKPSPSGSEPVARSRCTHDPVPRRGALRDVRVAAPNPANVALTDVRAQHRTRPFRSRYAFETDVNAPDGSSARAREQNAERDGRDAHESDPSSDLSAWLRRWVCRCCRGPQRRTPRPRVPALPCRAAWSSSARAMC